MNSNCYNCGKELKRNANFCTNCGCEVNSTVSNQNTVTDPKSKVLKTISVIGIAGIIVVAITSILSGILIFSFLAACI